MKNRIDWKKIKWLNLKRNWVKKMKWDNVLALHDWKNENKNKYKNKNKKINKKKNKKNKL